MYYKSTSFAGPATVIKVHYDDELQPFYTVEVDGKEKQTDDAHLEEKNPLHVEIDNWLPTLSGDQLKQVHQLVSNMVKQPATMTSIFPAGSTTTRTTRTRRPK